METTEDYCVLFEVHDDIVSLHDWNETTYADFYQVKPDTTGKAWTSDRLIYRNKGKGDSRLPSILGKLYSHCDNLGRFARRLTFVTKHVRVTAHTDNPATMILQTTDAKMAEIA